VEHRVFYSKNQKEDFSMASENATHGSAEGQGSVSWEDADATGSVDATTGQKAQKTSKKASQEETPPAESQEETQESVEEEGQVEPEVTEEEPTEEPSEQETEQDERDSEIASLKAQVEKLTEISNFYMNQANKQIKPDGQIQTPEKPQQRIPPQKPGELPEGVLPPVKWDRANPDVFFNQMTGYLDHRFNDNVQNVTKQFDPVFRTFSQTIGALRQEVAKLIHSDFDKVIENTLEEVFIRDPQTKKITDIKNPALLEFFKQSPFPELAMYKHGLKTPAKIKEGVTKQVKKIVEKIGTKPKGPTKPKGASAAKTSVDLDWETPASQRDAILEKKGLIGR